MPLIQQSFERLYPNREFSYQTEIEYNRRLSDFNANISLHKNKIKVNFNLQWKSIDDEIKIGLIQHLLTKVFKTKTSTFNIKLYNQFIKNIHILTPKTQSDPILEEAFNLVNATFLESILEQPNLKWGRPATRKLAHYNFHNDTIVVSSIFKEAPQHMLNYIMYHEMLHKHFKFSHSNGRSSFHSKEFRQAEKLFPNSQQLEKEISLFIYKRKKTKQKKTGFLASFFQ